MELTADNHDFSTKFHQHYWGINRGHSRLHGQEKFLPPILPYSMNALEPVFDAKCVKDHYLNHHMKSFENFLALMAEEQAEQYDIDYFLSNKNQFSPELLYELGGWLNHQLFWNNLSPYGGEMSSMLENAISKQFGDVYHFKLKFIEMASSIDCCGWSWLIKNENGEIEILNTPENLNPIMDSSSPGRVPILVIDMWEHAYTTKYKKDKTLYLKSIWMLINWNEVSNRFHNLTSYQ